MKRVQARLPNGLHQRVLREARRSGRSVDAFIREALAAYLHVDPIFRAFPLVTRKGKASDNVSERVDEILYGDPHGPPK